MVMKNWHNKKKVGWRLIKEKEENNDNKIRKYMSQNGLISHIILKNK